ncbi:MAG: guanylate kinase [Ignavibacteriales bacterium]|nr:guanylate kinase [Ignavibacteriales bacterium]
MHGKLIVISAPSGSGKTTIANAVLRKFPSILFSVSATTRPKRSDETGGKEYFFLTKEEFQAKVKQGDLVEWEEIYGDLYGTLKSEVDKALAADRVMLFDVDVKGALSIKRAYPEAVLIFVKPPSFQELKERLRNRKTENEAALARRLERVPMELQLGERFDYQVVNDDLQRAIGEVEHIVREHTELDSIHS